MKRIVLLVAGILLLGAFTAHAGIQPYKFDNPEQLQRFQQLSSELRCLVCQNENLADSNADLAHDLRSQIHDMIMGGKSNHEIIHYMVARYGDFVLYKPPVQPNTYLLWFGPFVLVVLGLIALVVFIRKHQRKSPAMLSDEERRRLHELLHDSGETPRR